MAIPIKLTYLHTCRKRRLLHAAPSRGIQGRGRKHVRHRGTSYTQRRRRQFRGAAEKKCAAAVLRPQGARGQKAARAPRALISKCRWNSRRLLRPPRPQRGAPMPDSSGPPSQAGEAEAALERLEEEHQAAQAGAHHKSPREDDEAEGRAGAAAPTPRWPASRRAAGRHGAREREEEAEEGEVEGEDREGVREEEASILKPLLKAQGRPPAGRVEGWASPIPANPTPSPCCLKMLVFEKTPAHC